MIIDHSASEINSAAPVLAASPVKSCRVCGAAVPPKQAGRAGRPRTLCDACQAGRSDGLLDLGNRLQSARIARNVTVQQVADALGVNVSVIHAAESGVRAPREKLLSQLWEVLAPQSEAN